MAGGLLGLIFLVAMHYEFLPDMKTQDVTAVGGHAIDVASHANRSLFTLTLFLGRNLYGSITYPEHKIGIICPVKLKKLQVSEFLAIFEQKNKPSAIRKLKYAW